LKALKIYFFPDRVKRSIKYSRSSSSIQKKYTLQLTLHTHTHTHTIVDFDIVSVQRSSAIFCEYLYNQ